MKNVFKKTLSLAFAGIFSVSVLTACGESASLIPFLEDYSGDLDLDGSVFSIADIVSEEGATFLGYKENTVLYDAALQRFADIEKELNCEIELDDVKEGVLFAKVIANACTNDIFYGAHGAIQDLAQGGFAEPVTNYLDIIDVNNYEKYGTPSVQECNAFGGELIALSPLSWLYKQPTALELLIFNMDHVDRYGKTNPREYIENGIWNWDTFENVISDYYVNEGDIEISSLVCRPMDLLKLFILGNGVTLTIKDETGAIKPNFGSSEMMEAIDFYSRLRTEYKENIDAEDSWEYLVDSFAETQDSMICLTAAWQLYETIIYEVKNYSVMPFPTGPRGEYGKWPSIVEGMQGYVVLKSCVDPEIAFRVVDMICEPLSGYETRESRVDYLETNVFYDPFDAEVTLTTHDNGTYSYWKAEIGNFQPDTLWREISKNNRSASEVVAQYSSIFNQTIEEFMIPNVGISEFFE